MKLADKAALAIFSSAPKAELLLLPVYFVGEQLGGRVPHTFVLPGLPAWAILPLLGCEGNPCAASH
jgi:hypothetical protein